LFGQKEKGRLLPLGWLAAKHAPSRFGGHGHARKARTAAMPPGQNRTSFCSVSGFLDSASIFFGGFPPLRRHHGEAQNGGFFVHAIGRHVASLCCDETLVLWTHFPEDPLQTSHVYHRF